MAPIMHANKNILQSGVRVFLSAPSLSIGIAGLCRLGPFHKYGSELSAERGLAETVLTHGGIVHVVQPLQNGEAVSVRIRECVCGAHEKSCNTLEQEDIVLIVGGALSGNSVTKQHERNPLSKPTLSQDEVTAMFDAYECVRCRLQNAWHEQRWRGSTNDSHKDFHLSTEFGWSTMPGCITCAI